MLQFCPLTIDSEVLYPTLSIYTQFEAFVCKYTFLDSCSADRSMGIKIRREFLNVRVELNEWILCEKITFQSCWDLRRLHTSKWLKCRKTKYLRAKCARTCARYTLLRANAVHFVVIYLPFNSIGFRSDIFASIFFSLLSHLLVCFCVIIWRLHTKRTSSAI